MAPVTFSIGYCPPAATKPILTDPETSHAAGEGTENTHEGAHDPKMLCKTDRDGRQMLGRHCIRFWEDP